jgi:hypothetical protein
MLPLPRDPRLPPINLEELEPAPEEVERMREALTTPDAQTWWEAALELGVIGALGTADPELKERLWQRGRELGCFNRALDELAAKPAGAQCNVTVECSGDRIRG